MKTTKRIVSAGLAALMAMSGTALFSAYADEVEAKHTISFDATAALYVHSGNSADDTEAWTMWQCEHDDYLNEVNTDTKYFFLPSGADSSRVEVYNGYSESVTVNGVSIAAGDSEYVDYVENKEYSVAADGSTYTLEFLHSSAEAAIFVNGTKNGTDLMDYLNADKSNSSKASGAIVSSDGSTDNTAIKKIKGRGNTTWSKSKKPYNITYDKKVSIAGMEKGKKYSLLANYQDDSLSRNRFLYDLSDAVGMPYASDSRYVDLYSNGEYLGSYQLAEKVDSIVDIDEEYLNEDGTVKDDFSFLCEIDPSAAEDDFSIECSDGIKITVKLPEVEDVSSSVKSKVESYVKSKWNAFYKACKNKSTDIADYADVDSLAKLWLINELGKNWDSGVSSVYFVYKPDEDGNYKFYGSPVWDYDNSLGNANGLPSFLADIGVDDYTEYTGWWCRYNYLSKGSDSTTNIMNNISRNSVVKEAAVKIWFEQFVPAIDYFAGNSTSYSGSDEIYTREQYYSLIEGSAEMNYTSGWLLYTSSSWICDHTSLKKASFDVSTGTYTESTSATSYDQGSFEDMFNYCADWLVSRAAWISNEWYEDYYGTSPKNTCSVESGTFSGETMTVTLGLKNATSGTYCLDNSTPVTYTDTVTIRIGSDYADGDTINLTLTATDGTKVTTALYQYKKNASASGVYVFFKASAQENWEAPFYCYVYDTGSTSGTVYNNGNWKTTEMSYDDASGYYYYEVPSDSCFVNGTVTSFDLAHSKNTMVIISSENDEQYPESGADGYLLNGSSKIFGETGAVSWTSTTLTPASTADDATDVTKDNQQTDPTATDTTDATTPTGATTSTTSADPTDSTDSTATEKPALPGDVNLDGAVNINDVTAVQKHIAEIAVLTDETQLRNADVDGSGTISIKDATYIQKKIAGIITKFPAE